MKPVFGEKRPYVVLHGKDALDAELETVKPAAVFYDFKVDIVDEKPYKWAVLKLVITFTDGVAIYRYEEMITAAPAVMAESDEKTKEKWRKAVEAVKKAVEKELGSRFALRRGELKW